MRAFVALIPPEEAVADLSYFLAPRREVRTGSTGPVAPRWTRDEHLHLTLAFLPELADRDLEELCDQLAQVAARRSCGELRLAGGGAFPNAFDARVLWIGVEPGTADDAEAPRAPEVPETPAAVEPQAPEPDELGRLADAVRTAAGVGGVRVQGGEIRPHVTVARMARAQEATRWLRVLQNYRGPTWRPAEIVLIRSHLGQGPRRSPRYETLESFPLVAGA